MKRIGAISLALLLSLFLFAFAGCKNENVYENGVYRAEFKDFDARGYKDYLVITVEGKRVTGIEFNGINKDGDLKSEDEDYQIQMEDLQGTNPSKYSTDVVNQYLEKLDIKNVDIVAGATYSTNSFKALFFALESNMKAGDTTLVLVDNIPMI